jgi:uncharacterized protein
MIVRQSPNLLLIAARAPVAGETKTRLGKSIGMERAAILYEAFLRDLAVRLTVDGDAYDIGWTHSPPEIDFRPWLDRIGATIGPGVHVVPQEGPDWGARQDYLLRWAHEQGYERSVLIASDSPHLEGAVIRQAFAELSTHDVVMGRVLDGGYYLVGLNGYSEVLHDVPMSTSSAADALVARAAALGCSLAELPATFDVDTAADLAHLVRTLAPDGGNSPATWEALARLGLVAQ